MALAVYSTRFILRPFMTGYQSYLVPVGYVAVVRDLDVVTEPTSGNVILLAIAGNTIFISELGVEPAFTNQEWRGRAVAYPGDLISLDTSDTASGHVSGYLLTSP